MKARLREIVVILIMVIAVAWVATADAGGDVDVLQSNDMNTVKGDIGYHNKNISVSGSGMEIRDCIATHSILFGLWQGTHVNKSCEAERLNRDGLYQAAAEMKCSIRGVRGAYPKGKCIEMVKLSAPPAPLPPVVEDDDDEEEWREEQMAMQIDYTAQIEELKQTIAQAPAPVVTHEVVKTRYLSDKQRTALAEVLAE